MNIFNICIGMLAYLDSNRLCVCIYSIEAVSFYFLERLFCKYLGTLSYISAFLFSFDQHSGYRDRLKNHIVDRVSVEIIFTT